MQRISELLERLPKKWLVSIALGLVGLAGAIDYATGIEIQVSVLYLVPVGLASWYVSRGAGFAVSALCSVVWLVAEHTAGSIHARSFVAVWNAIVLLCFFLVVTFLVAKMHCMLFNLEREADQRREAEAVLAKSEDLYRTLVETAGDVMWAVDLNLNYTYVSPSVTKVLGYTVEEIMASNPLDGLSPNSRDKVVQALREELEKEYPNPRENHVSSSLEVERRHKDGTLRWIQYNSTFLRDCQGRPIGVIGISRDITERRKTDQVLLGVQDELAQRVAERTEKLSKTNERLREEIGERQRAERTLGESLAQFRALVEQIPAITYVAALDESASTVYISPQVETFLGIRQDEFREDPEIRKKLLHPDDRKRVLRSYRHIHETGRPFSSEYRMVAPDGRIRWFRDEAILVKDESGRALCVQGVMLDVTDAKHSLELLQESEGRFRTIFELAQDGIFVKDNRLTFTHVNSAWLGFHKMTREQVLGKTAEEIFDTGEAQRIRDLELRVLKGEILETRHEWPFEDHAVTFSTMRVTLRDSFGRVVGICGICRDIKELALGEPKPRIFAGHWNSPIFEETLAQIRLVAETDSTVLLLGESGTGKDYLTHYLHRHSRRGGGPFYSINCAALPDELAESELFGHESGAFTGANRRKRGLLELAEGGTLLLNDISELSLPLQAKLLHFLDYRSFTRVGGEQSISVDARIVAASNRDLKADVELGRFRKDLFYRLNVFSVRVPPLRQRTEDLSILVPELLSSLVDKMGLSDIPRIHPSAMSGLTSYSWPGNVRELRNILERALILCKGNMITSAQLPQPPFLEEPSERLCPNGAATGVRSSSVHEAVRETKRVHIVDALRQSGGSIKRAAMILQVSRDSHKHMMKTLGIRRR